MKPQLLKKHPMRAFQALLPILLALLVPAPKAGAQLTPTTLLSCPTGVGGDFTDRGFYIESYPGETLNSITVYLKTVTASGPLSYQVGINVTLDAYNGPAVGFYFANASIGTAETSVAISCGNVPIPVGRRVCFRFSINKQPGAPDLYYSVPDLNAICPNLYQTNGTEPPLSTARRQGVKLTVTGRRHLNVTAGQSIQAAIDAALVGDTVSVGPGTYAESLVLRSGINVKGAHASSVTLTPGPGTGVSASNCDGTEFSGFTLRPAAGIPLGDTGISLSGGSPLIKNNVITGFSARGIAIFLGTSAIVCGNRIQDNGTSRNLVADYGILCFKSSCLITNNLITGNEVGCQIEGAGSDGTTFINNTVANNTREGLRCHDDSRPAVRNNIITNNVTGVLSTGAGSNPILGWNDVWNNSGAGNYSGTGSGSSIPGAGSLSVNPVFLPSAPTEFRLATTSPCIDAGNPAAIENDFDGSRNDMGWTGGPCASPAVTDAPFGGFLFTSVGNIPANYIGSNGLANVPGADAGALAIPAWKNAPFAAQPWLYGVFGSGTSPYFYSVEYKLPAQPDTAYQKLSHPLSKVKYTITGSTISASLEAVGPIMAGTPAMPLYRSTNNGGNTYWAHDNLRLTLNTLTLPDGTYDFRVQGWNIFGDAIPLTGTPNKLTLWINNKPPVADILAIGKDGAPEFVECAIAGIATPLTNLNFRITASHPDGFLDDFSLNASYGRNQGAGTIFSDSYNPAHAGSIVWNGVTNQTYRSDVAMTAGRLTPWRTCAYTFGLGVWSRATNGYGRVYYSGFTYSLALNLGGADLDGDGDVDGDDLNIMAAAFGSPH